MDSFIINNFFNEQGIPPLAVNIFFLALFIWSIIWKGTALWHASKNHEKPWFVAILIINTAGILEIVYLLYFSKNKLSVEDALNFVRTLSLSKIKTLLKSK